MFARKKSSNKKVLLAALTGITAGIVVGILMAPARGKDTRRKVKKATDKLGDQIDKTVKAGFERIENLDLAKQFNDLNIRGNWEDISSALKKRYTQLTDKDLKVIIGKEREFVENLQKKLGKTRAEINRLISELR